MRVEERYERVLQAMEDLREASREAPILVEGKNDVRALRRLRCEGEILSLNSGSPIFTLCEQVARGHRAAIILTDWDRRGGQLCRLLREGLAANGVRFDVDLRGRLGRLCHKEVKDVEGLARYVLRIERATAEASPPIRRRPLHR